MSNLTQVCHGKPKAKIKKFQDYSKTLDCFFTASNKPVFWSHANRITSLGQVCYMFDDLLQHTENTEQTLMLVKSALEDKVNPNVILQYLNERGF